jgi:polyisoprenoid-binding protein YceI
MRRSCRLGDIVNAECHCRHGLFRVRNIQAAGRHPISAMRQFLPLLYASILISAPQVHVLQPDTGSRIEMLVTKTGLLRGKQHVLDFTRYRGELRYDPQAPLSSVVTLDIESASVVCRDTWVSEKDRRKIQAFAIADMLDGQNHPRIAFRSNAVKPAGRDQYAVAGTLIIRGIGKPVVVDVKLRTAEVLTFEGRAVIKLSDYGLKPPTAALGTIGTKDEMTLVFALTAKRAF